MSASSNDPEDKVRELQRTLWRAAKRNRGRRFHALYDRIYRSDVLWEGAASPDADHAGESPVTVIVRFDCVAVPDASTGRPGNAQAQAKVLAAVGRQSGPPGGRAKPGAAAESEHCSVVRTSPHESGCGTRGSRALFPGRRPMDNGEGNGPVQPWSPPAQGWRQQGNGQRLKAGKVSSPESSGHKLRSSEATSGDETGGSGRSSDEARDSITLAEPRARGTAPCARSEGRPDMPRGQRESRHFVDCALRRRQSRIGDEGRRRCKIPRCLEAVLGKTHRTEF
jgi:hypothetical protein